MTLNEFVHQVIEAVYQVMVQVVDHPELNIQDFCVVVGLTGVHLPQQGIPELVVSVMVGDDVVEGSRGFEGMKKFGKRKGNSRKNICRDGKVLEV